MRIIVSHLQLTGHAGRDQNPVMSSSPDHMGSQPQHSGKLEYNPFNQSLVIVMKRRVLFMGSTSAMLGKYPECPSYSTNCDDLSNNILLRVPSVRFC